MLSISSRKLMEDFRFFAAISCWLYYDPCVDSKATVNLKLTLLWPICRQQGNRQRWPQRHASAVLLPVCYKKAVRLCLAEDSSSSFSHTDACDFATMSLSLPTPMLHKTVLNGTRIRSLPTAMLHNVVLNGTRFIVHSDALQHLPQRNPFVLPKTRHHSNHLE